MYLKLLIYLLLTWHGISFTDLFQIQDFQLRKAIDPCVFTG